LLALLTSDDQNVLKLVRIVMNERDNPEWRRIPQLPTEKWLNPRF